jgi:hypothetical protein
VIKDQNNKEVIATQMKNDNFYDEEMRIRKDLNSKNACVFLKKFHVKQRMKMQVKNHKVIKNVMFLLPCSPQGTKMLKITKNR